MKTTKFNAFPKTLYVKLEKGSPVVMYSANKKRPTVEYIRADIVKGLLDSLVKKKEKT